MRNYHLASIRYARRPVHAAPNRSGPHRLFTHGSQHHNHNRCNPYPPTEHITRVSGSSIMLRADIPEDQKFTAAAQQLTAKSLKILKTAKWNNYTVKFKCNSIILCQYGVLINVFRFNRDVTIFALSCGTNLPPPRTDRGVPP